MPVEFDLLLSALNTYVLKTHKSPGAVKIRICENSLPRGVCGSHRSSRCVCGGGEGAHTPSGWLRGAPIFTHGWLVGWF